VDHTSAGTGTTTDTAATGDTRTTATDAWPFASEASDGWMESRAINMISILYKTIAVLQEVVQKSFAPKCRIKLQGRLPIFEKKCILSGFVIFQTGHIRRSLVERIPMKAGTHPKYAPVQVTCSCGNTFTTASTLSKPLHVEVCSECHPFYTGKQKIVDPAGRVEKFNQNFANLRRPA
jgi:large subunit ribosomal protein L31